MSPLIDELEKGPKMFNEYVFSFDRRYIDTVISSWESIRSGSNDTEFGIIFYYFGYGM